MTVKGSTIPLELKQDGFASAARAIIMEDTPVTTRLEHTTRLSFASISEEYLSDQRPAAYHDHQDNRHSQRQGSQMAARLQRSREGGE